ncbi:MAG: abortive phage infection protein [Clostridiales bacterium]|nr:abortive phage infection protein [Clostridiales bacterium]
MSNMNSILKIGEANKGIITATEVTNHGIPRRVLTEMVEKNLISKAARGIYLLPDAWEDEWLLTQYRYSKGIYSHGTALFLHGYTDRTPFSFELTFPQGYHNANPKDAPIIEKFAVKKIYTLGVITLESPAGHPIRAYDLEKSLCDILRGEKDFDIELVNSAMKKYFADKNRNIFKLKEYAKILKVEKKVNKYMEILL